MKMTIFGIIVGLLSIILFMTFAQEAFLTPVSAKVLFNETSASFITRLKISSFSQVPVMMTVLKFLPLFALILVGYWLMHQIGYFPQHINDVLFHVPLPSGQVWKPTWGDMVILIGLVFLYIEIFKSTRTSAISIIDHTLSTLVFVAFLVSWMVFPWAVGDASNSVFLILTVMSFIDVIAGFTITISAARRDLALGGR